MALPRYAKHNWPARAVACTSQGRFELHIQRELTNGIAKRARRALLLQLLQQCSTVLLGGGFCGRVKVESQFAIAPRTDGFLAMLKFPGIEVWPDNCHSCVCGILKSLTPEVLKQFRNPCVGKIRRGQDWIRAPQGDGGIESDRLVSQLLCLPQCC